MVFVRLLWHAVASSGMTWGLIVVGLLLVSLADYLWERISGKSEVLREAVMRWKLSLAPGIVAIVWYAAYAAHQVNQDSWEDSLGRTIAVHTVAVVGLAVAAVLFDLASRFWFEAYERLYVPLAVAGLSLVSYVAFLFLPATAEFLSAAWLNVLMVFGLFASN
jgi:hypothetical protein